MIVLALPNPVYDGDLLQQAQHGDSQAISEIYQLYLESIYQFVRLRVGNSQTAEDITSTVFLKMIRELKRGRGPRTNLRAWLFRVARNEIYDHYGEKTQLPMETIEHSFEDHSNPNPEIELLKAADADTVRSALQQLSPEQQEVIVLRFDQMLSLQETADIMARNINTIKTMQFRAVNRLRQLIQQQMLRGQQA